MSYFFVWQCDYFFVWPLSVMTLQVQIQYTNQIEHAVACSLYPQVVVLAKTIQLPCCRCMAQHQHMMLVAVKELEKQNS